MGLNDRQFNGMESKCNVMKWKDYQKWNVMEWGKWYETEQMLWILNKWDGIEFMK